LPYFKQGARDSDAGDDGDDAHRRPAASFRAIYLRQFVVDYDMNI